MILLQTVKQIRFPPLTMSYIIYKKLRKRKKPRLSCTDCQELVEFAQGFSKCLLELILLQKKEIYGV